MYQIAVDDLHVNQEPSNEMKEMHWQFYLNCYSLYLFQKFLIQIITHIYLFLNSHRYIARNDKNLCSGSRFNGI